MNDELRQLVAEILGVAASQITDEFGPDVSDTWDSLHHLQIVSAVEQEFGVSLTMPEIRSVDSFGRLAALVRAKAASP